MINHSTTSGLVVCFCFFLCFFFYAYIRCISWRMGHLRAIFSIQCFVMQGIICKGLHSGQVGDIDLHEMWSGKTKATPTQTSLLGEKQQLNHSLNPQPVCLSRCIETCQPNSCQRKQCPVEGQLYIMFIWAALRRETRWKLYGLITTSIYYVAKIPNKPAQ